MGNHVIKGAYYHELFLRGRPELSKLMVPIRHTEASRCSVRRKLDPRSEPNFCRMAPAPPSSHIVASAPLNLLPSTTNTNVTPKATAVGRTHASDGSRRNSVQIKTPLEIRDVTFYDPSVSLDRSVAVAPSSRPSHPIQSFNEVVLCPLVETSGCTSTTPVSPPPAGEALIERKHLPAFAAPGEMSPSCQRIPQAIDVPLLILLDSPNLAAVSSTKRGNNDKSHMQYLEDPLQKSPVQLPATEAAFTDTNVPKCILPVSHLQHTTDQGHVDNSGSDNAFDIEYECDSLC